MATRGITRFGSTARMLHGEGFGLMPLPQDNWPWVVRLGENTGPAEVQLSVEPLTVTDAVLIAPPEGPGMMLPSGATSLAPVGMRVMPGARAFAVPTLLTKAVMGLSSKARLAP